MAYDEQEKELMAALQTLMPLSGALLARTPK